MFYIVHIYLRLSFIEIAVPNLCRYQMFVNVLTDKPCYVKSMIQSEGETY